jgi:hypothetical protein
VNVGGGVLAFFGVKCARLDSPQGGASLVTGLGDSQFRVGANLVELANVALVPISDEPVLSTPPLVICMPRPSTAPFSVSIVRNGLSFGFSPRKYCSLNFAMYLTPSIRVSLRVLRVPRVHARASELLKIRLDIRHNMNSESAGQDCR